MKTVENGSPWSVLALFHVHLAPLLYCREDEAVLRYYQQLLSSTPPDSF